MKTMLKKLILLLVVAFFTSVGNAQVPEGFNFQAVARDANGNLLTNQALGVKVSVLKGSETGSDVYSETHSTITNSNGLLQLVIGEGIAAEGQSFSAINFSNDNYFIKLAIDPAGGTEYADLGTTRLLSVPYALVAKNVVNGGGGPSEAITKYNLNTSVGDTSFNISATGTKSILGALQIRSETDGGNRGVDSRVTTNSGNESTQIGVYGRTDGLGSGLHIGLYGIALGASGGNNIGSYGYALGTGKYNHGVYAVATGEGSGEIVPIGQEVDNNFGSYNIAGGFYSSGNLNGNVGVEAQTSGDKGGRIDFGVISRAIGTSNSPNIGIRGEAHSSPVQNVALEGDASGMGTKNLGLRLNVFNGSSNIGLEVNADTATILNGHSIINGNLTVNGTINGEVGSGDGITNKLIIQSDSLVNRFTTFTPGYIKLQDEIGRYSNFSRSALQYGDSDSEGTGFVYNWYSKGSMQVANPDYLNGEKSAGMSGGYFYMDIAKNENFYVPLQFGIGNATEGGRSWFEMSSLKRAEDGKGPAFSVKVINNSDGNDPTGESAELFLHGNSTPNFQFGGQSWENNNLPFFSMYGSTANGGGWYHSNIDMSVQSDGIDEWGSLSLHKTNITGQTKQETIMLDGDSGNINISGTLTQSSDVRLKKDIHTLDNALEKTLKMRGVSYTWKTDLSNENPQIGIIAQEVEKIYPEFVHTDEVGMKSVNYAQMTAVLIEAVKSLNSEIQVLKASYATLQAKVETQNELEVRLTKIEKLLQIESSLHSLAKVSIDK